MNRTPHPPPNMRGRVPIEKAGAPSFPAARERVGGHPSSANGHQLNGQAEEWGPLVRQSAPAARLARILHHSASELWELCTLTDTGQMQQEARAIASRILASSPGDPNPL